MTTQLEALPGLDDFTIEVPSWAYGNSGTRFKVFATPGVPRDPFEKLADAAQVHAVTGVAPRVSLHIPWDRVDDYAALAAHAEELGVEHRRDQLQPVPGRRLQARLADPRRRRRSGRKAIDHHLRVHRRSCAQTGSTRPEALAARRHQLRRARTRCAAGRTGWPTRCSRSTPRSDDGPAAAAGVQVLRAVLLRDGHPGLGHVAAALPGAGRAGAGRPGHRPPRAGHQHRVHRHAAAARRAGWARSTSTPATTPTTT